MNGETDLAILLRSLSPVTDPEIFVFCNVENGYLLPPGIEPLLRFREAEGMTLILSREDARKANLPYSFPCRKITLKVHSSLEAVGVIADVAGRLADSGISVNPVSGYYHDHLFVPVDKADLAMSLLELYAQN